MRYPIFFLHFKWGLLFWFLKHFAHHTEGGKHLTCCVNEVRPMSLIARRSEVEWRCVLDERMHKVSLLSSIQLDALFLRCCCCCYQHHAGPSRHPHVGFIPSWFTIEGVYQYQFWWLLMMRLGSNTKQSNDKNDCILTFIPVKYP